MKVKKSMTEKVIAANRANAHKTAGPRNTEAVRQNAVKHGLLAKHLIFGDEEEKNAFNSLLHGPRTRVLPRRTNRAAALVEEVAICLWKLQTANDWEIQELGHRRQAAKAILRAVAENHCEEPAVVVYEGGRHSVCRSSRLGLPRADRYAPARQIQCRKTKISRERLRARRAMFRLKPSSRTRSRRSCVIKRR